MGDLSAMSIGTKLSALYADRHPMPFHSSRKLLRAAWAIPMSGLLLWAASLPAASQEIQGVVRARGVGIGITAADVRLLDRHDSLKAERRTNDHGRFTFKHLDPGPYSIHVDAPGFAHAVTAQVLVDWSSVVELTVWLDPQPVTMPKLVVEAHRRVDKFIRLHIGMSLNSLNPADVAVGTRLEKLMVGSYTLADMLRKQAIPGLVVLFNVQRKQHIPGLLDPIETGGICFQLRGAVGLGGYPICATVYLDGLPVDPDMMWTIEVRDIGAIVVLEADEEGVLYGAPGGVILVYTREYMGLGPGG